MTNKKNNDKKFIEWARHRNYESFESYGSWAGRDGEFLRKSTSKTHKISSKLFYFFQLNFKKKKKLPLTKISTLENESSKNRKEKLLIEKLEEKIEREKAKGLKSEEQMEEFVQNEKENLYYETEKLYSYDSIDDEIYPGMDLDRKRIVREILKRKNNYNKIHYFNHLKQKILALLSLITPTPQKKDQDSNKLIFKIKKSLESVNLSSINSQIDSNQKDIDFYKNKQLNETSKDSFNDIIIEYHEKLNEDLKKNLNENEDPKTKLTEVGIDDLKKEIFQSLMKEVKNTINLIENDRYFQETILQNICLDISQEICSNEQEIEFTISKDIPTNGFVSLLEPEQENHMILHPNIQQEIQEIENQNQPEKPFYGDIVIEALLNIPYYWKHLGPDA